MQPAECASGHCAEDFLGAASSCAPVGQCLDGAVLRGDGFVQCARDGSYLRTCTGGTWVTTANPQPMDMYCGGAGHSNGGFSPRLGCTSGAGGGFEPGVCVSCEPYVAASPGACATSCALDNDALCWGGYHCYSGDGQCYPSAADPANRCDVDGECGGGSCDGTCQPLLGAGALCQRSAQCGGGTCFNGVCCAGGTCCTPAAMGQCGPFLCDPVNFSCNTTCIMNTNAACAPGFHCFSGNSQCFSNSDGNLCDSNADCASGYCQGNTCAPARPIQRIDVQCCSQGTNCVAAGGGGGPFRFVRVTSGGAVLGDLTPLAMASPGALYSTSGTLQFTTFMDVTTGSYFATFGGEGSSPLTCHFTFRTTNGTMIWVDSFDATNSDQVVRSGTAAGDAYRRFFYDGATVTSSTQTSL